MGFKSGKIIKNESFEPLDLNEGNVAAIFNRCVATKETPNDEIWLSVLFLKRMGYEEDSRPVGFCKPKLEQNKKNILYLMGQLNSVHQGDRGITANESIIKYDGSRWTVDTVIIMKLYHLAEVVNAIAPFIKASNRSMTEPIVKPTLSPKDPNFPAWWEAHKGEWE